MVGTAISLSSGNIGVARDGGVHRRSRVFDSPSLREGAGGVVGRTQTLERKKERGRRKASLGTCKP